jgi:hypothetical protein
VVLYYSNVTLRDFVNTFALSKLSDEQLLNLEQAVSVTPQTRGHIIDINDMNPREYEITLSDGRKFTAEFLYEPTQIQIDEAAEKYRISHPEPFFRVGSVKDDVRRIQGSPTSIIGNIWFYGNDSVSFNYGDKVSGYMNNSGKLKIK